MITDEGDIDVRLKLRDTINLAPSLKKSLLELGKILGYEKIKLGSSDEEEQYIKENMKEFMLSNWDKFTEYGIRDAEICVKYTIELINLNYRETGKYILPVTLTSSAVDILLKTWSDNGWDQYQLVGKYKTKDRYFNLKYKQYNARDRYVYFDKIHWKIDFVTECYHGGRNEQFWFGPAFEYDWYDWDIKSAYATVMSMIGQADWESCKFITDVDELLNYDVEDLAFASIKFEFPDTVKYPCLPVRTAYGLVFPLKGISNCSIPEILLAHKLGARISLREGVYIPSNKKIRIFEKFIIDCLKKRQEARKQYGKGSLYEQFWKEMSNSTYGKTAQGLRERRVFDLKDRETKQLEESSITNPFFAAFITSYVRAVLGEIMNKIPNNRCVFSVTTDGFLVNAGKEILDQSQSGLLCDRLRKARYRLDNLDTSGKDYKNTDILEVKHRIRQPLGWRTRGQATIKPSHHSNDIDSNHVLAKTGIPLSKTYEKPAQNHKIVDYFIRRTPTSTIRNERLTGIRPSYEDGNDIVTEVVDRILNMEFDWKRRPYFIADGTFEFDNKKYSHVFWETKPWDSVEQFIEVREIFLDYNKLQRNDEVAFRKCIKTKEQYDVFCEYLLNVSSLESENRPYMKRNRKSDLHRLRLSILSAWRRGRAGFVKFDAYNHQPREMKEILNEFLNPYDVKCTDDQVYNTKKDYVPHAVPRNDRTIDILKNIKKKYFKFLDIKDILSQNEGIDIRSVNVKDSQYKRYYKGFLD